MIPHIFPRIHLRNEDQRSFFGKFPFLRIGINDGLHVHMDCVDWHYSVCTYHKILDNEAHNKDEEMTT